MKQLMLTNVDKFALVDDEDYERLVHYKWSICGGNKCNIRRQTETPIYGRSYYVSLASDVMQKHKQMFDHKDLNPFNNQKLNLRMCDAQQNAANRTKCKRKCSSKYKGVHWSIKDCRWIANTAFKGTRIYLGSYLNEIDAAKAYDTKAKELFGEFAVLNFN